MPHYQGCFVFSVRDLSQTLLIVIYIQKFSDDVLSPIFISKTEIICVQYIQCIFSFTKGIVFVSTGPWLFRVE